MLMEQIIFLLYLSLENYFCACELNGTIFSKTFLQAFKPAISTQPKGYQSIKKQADWTMYINDR